MTRSRRSWFERIEIQKVTLDWLRTNYHPTGREIELIQLIQQRKLVSREHLEIISPTYRNLKSRTRLINRSISRMFSNMVVDKCHLKQEFGKGNKSCIISLDRGGSVLLNIPHIQRIIRTKKIIHGEDYIFRSLPSNFRHINGVNQLEVETILLLEQTNGEIKQWIHEKIITFYYGQEKMVMKPDVIGELNFNKNKDKPFYFFIEFDTGSESIRYKEPPVIRDKIIKYRKYRASKLWEKTYPYFPYLLFVTEDEKRIPFFNKKCKENGLSGRAIYYKNYTKFLTHLTNKV